jgi:hypothetical protein
MEASPLQKQIEVWKGEAETAHDELAAHGVSNNRSSLAFYDGVIQAYTAVLRVLIVENDAALERERHPLVQVSGGIVEV